MILVETQQLIVLVLLGLAASFIFGYMYGCSEGEDRIKTLKESIKGYKVKLKELKRNI